MFCKFSLFSSALAACTSMIYSLILHRWVNISLQNHSTNYEDNFRDSQVDPTYAFHFSVQALHKFPTFLFHLPIYVWFFSNICISPTYSLTQQPMVSLLLHHDVIFIKSLVIIVAILNKFFISNYAFLALKLICVLIKFEFGKVAFKSLYKICQNSIT